MTSLWKRVFHPHQTNGELTGALKRRKKATKEVRKEAVKVQGAALDAVDREQAVVRAIDDLIKRINE